MTGYPFGSTTELSPLPYNECLPELLLSLIGAALTLAAAWAAGRFLLRHLPVPPVLFLAAGAPLLSLAIFGLLVFSAASAPAFLTLLAAMLALLFFPRRVEPVLEAEPRDRGARLLAGCILGPYGVLYIVNALAPEIQPDAYNYHLGLVSAWLREPSAFTSRVGFYDVLPLGLQTVFAAAFSLGKHTAAKLVHLALLAATVPLLFSLGRRLRLKDYVPAAASVLYVCSPVAGISGTASYTDAALVFFMLAALWLLLAWHGQDDDRYLLPAGLVMGFCYALKISALVLAPVALVWVLSRRRARASLLFAAGLVLAIAPWMIRAAALTGNPLAPLYNGLFPNPHFYESTEKQLAQMLRNYGGVQAFEVPAELTLKGRRLQGLIGPVFLLTPLALLVLRRRAGRLLLAAAAIAAIPWFFNLGARFLMPALALLSVALALSLPRRLALLLAGIQAVACWPQVVDLYADRDAWRLRGMPWRAALRLEPEPDYLRRVLPAYRVSEMVERHARPGDRVLDLATSSAAAYHRAESLTPWHSAEAERLSDALKLASPLERGILFQAREQWSNQILMGLRVRTRTTAEREWSALEIEVLGEEGEEVRPDRRWILDAWPNPWETPALFDRNLSTRWTTRQPVRTGMHVDVYFQRPILTTGVRLVLPWWDKETSLELYGLPPGQPWTLLSAALEIKSHAPVNLRTSATQSLRRQRIRYILTPVGYEGIGLLGRTLVDNPGDWGVEVLEHAGDVYMLAIR